ncbi:MAG: transporter substrate-binding domain-containing protein [Desulfobacterales bacterium]|nr:transporter substrate-binding domain-containing protein [Desulfobacterales bacterium]
MVAQEEPVTAIEVVTPQWEGQANADGTGLFCDILRAVYEPRGVGVRFRMIPWTRGRSMVEAGQGDALLCVLKGREGDRDLSRFPLYVERTAAVYKRHSIPRWDGIHSLDYTRAVWLRGYDYQLNPRLRAIQFGDWQEADSHENAWLQLNLDQYDIYIDALVDIDRFMADHAMDSGLYEKQILWTEAAHVGFAPTERGRLLRRMFDRGIRDLYQGGRLQGLYDKWGRSFDPAHWAGIKPAFHGEDQ